MSRVPWYPSSLRHAAPVTQVRRRPKVDVADRFAQLGLWLGLAGLALVTSGSLFHLVGMP